MIIAAQLASFLVTQTEGAASDAGPLGGLFGMVPLLLMFAVVYLLLIRPANKQRREHQTLLSALKKDDEVVTTGGIYGRIISLEERVVTLEIADRVKVRVLRDRIAGRWAAATETPKK
ncbi:MAG: preprotein translocase subunit YajC [Myxococcota bacterium]